MKIAIHHRPGSFSDRWIDYCEKNSIDYILVNAYDSDIINKVKGCDAFMWHHHHSNAKDVLFAKQLIYSLETIGIKCFPDFHTVWHFDDKVGQKYLFEAIGAPIVPSYVFYTKKDALDWIAHTSFPKVFKLRGGAGSKNVLLAQDKKEAIKLVKKAFGKGFPQTSIKNTISEDLRKHREGKEGFIRLMKDILLYYFTPNSFHKAHSVEKGYAYFQDFIPNNTTDYRVKVIKGRCWAFQRIVRKNDFRASGGGNLVFDNQQIPYEIVVTAQKIARELQLQSVAFDFIHDKINNKYLIVEMSYGFGFDEREIHNGYWDCEGVFCKEIFNPFGWMIECLIK